MTATSNEFSPSAIVEFLKKVFNLSVDGVTGLTGAEKLAEEYLKEAKGDAEAAITNLIWWQTAQSSALGFGLNVGGLITLPITIPADLAATAVLQLRMVAAIAHLRGYDIRSDNVRTFGIMCLLGSAVAEIVKEAGIQLGLKLTAQAIGQISGQTIITINQAVGFRLLTKAGSTGIANLSKFVPLVGGVVGGLIDGFTTAGAATAAKQVFTASPKDAGDAGPGFDQNPT